MWKDVAGYEGCYMVSNFGRVMSLGREVPNSDKSNRIIRPSIMSLNIKNAKRKSSIYQTYTAHLCKNRIRKAITVHRLVACAFIENPNNYPSIDHIDGNPMNNHVSNLRWCTNTINMNNPITRSRISLSKKGKYNTPKMGWGGNNNGGFFGNRGNGGGEGLNILNNDSTRELLMSAIQGNGNAISQLSTQLGCTTGQIQDGINTLNMSLCNVGNQVGMSGQQVINAIQAGNCTLANQIASCCCDVRTAIERQGYESQLATLGSIPLLLFINAGKMAVRSARPPVEGSPNMKIFSLPIKMSFFWLNEYFISIKLREGRSGFNYFA